MTTLGNLQCVFMNTYLRNPYLVMTTVCIIWAGNAVAGKLAAGHVSPMLLTLLRWIFAVLLIAPFAWGDVRREWPILRRHLALMFVFGGVGFTGFNALFYWALNHTTAINVTIEQSAMPLMVFLGNLLLFHIRFTLLQVVGFLLTVVGVVLTVTHGHPQALLQLDLNRGDALMLIAVFMYGSYTLALRYKPTLHWRSTIFVLALSALITAIPFAAYEWTAGYGRWPDLQGWGVVLYIAIFPSLFAQSLYIRGVELIGPNRANLFINLVPIFGSLLAVTLLGESLEGFHMLAILFVLSGLFLAERGAPKPIS